MELVKEIREYFASVSGRKAMEIRALPVEYPAYVIRIPDGYGVAIEIATDIEVSEKFNSIKLHTGVMTLGGKVGNFLILRSTFEEYRYEFAFMCAEFVDPGENGTNRKRIITDPCSWWSKWKEMVGNINLEQRVYSVVAEMMVLDQKYRTDATTVWKAPEMGSHDIECAEESCEVKSTIKRYGADVIISGQHQLEHIKRLFLYFCRLEESTEGVSINDMKAKLISAGYDESKLEAELEKMGFERGSSSRNKKYKKLEGRVYEVDDSFPRIVKSSFKNNKYPDAIIHIQYTVDLDGIEYGTW